MFFPLKINLAVPKTYYISMYLTSDYADKQLPMKSFNLMQAFW